MINDEYNSYLKSEEWKKIRKTVLLSSNGCIACGSQRILQVHHLHYRNIFCEDIKNDLVVLCKSCHKNVHIAFNNRSEKYRSLKDITQDFILNKGYKEMVVKKTKIKEKITFMKFRRKKRKTEKEKEKEIMKQKEISRMYKEVLLFHSKRISKLSPRAKIMFKRELYEIILKGRK